MKKTFKLGNKQKTISRTVSQSRGAIKFAKKVMELQDTTIMDPYADGYKETAVAELELTMIDLYVQRASEFLEQPEDYFEDIDYFDIIAFVTAVQKFLTEQEDAGKPSGEM